MISQGGLTDCLTTEIPLELNVKLSPTDGIPLKDCTCYREFVCSLVYLTVTRPDTQYAVHIVSPFQATLHSVHWATVLRILRYLRCTHEFTLFIFFANSSGLL